MKENINMNNYENLKNSHPCFAGHKANKGRIHLPVSPGCNIQCKFCDRKINDYEQRPGVTSVVIKPDEALEVVRKSLELCPEITVVGIAGPGDTLATDYALNTFRLIKEAFPDIIKCMSTNGLLLEERAEEIIEVGIDSLTVTVNAVDPAILTRLNSAIIYHGKHYEGEEAAAILIRNQLAGIQKVSEAGITIKVNTVLVPGINDLHIEEIARTVSEAGASIYNLIPLIPQHELSECEAPNCMQIETARGKAAKYIDVFRHCQRCRADAIGIPGEKDFGDQIYLNRIAHKDTFSHG
ncbi:nitrogen fixation protein NifB [Anaerocolumna xylanovorans DSM 12503]|uniref:FeMo cofactor biosynthesis protein NifB n=2 Tax=Anaerocolumna TaxID=1843210 RepID=A0A1M7XX74_9FIRM|nr:nitrogen fixation protein NifB [Anaerocolumna xylanovorans DSM 12503]